MGPCGPSLPRRQFLAAAMAAGITPANPRVRLDSVFGSILIELDLARAPASAGEFLACIDAGRYNDGAFVRTVNPGNDHGHPPISVLQGAAAAGPPRKPIVHETTARTGLRHRDGTLSLPRDGVGTATGLEFFICIGDQPALDFGGARNRDGQGFAAFGQVVSGMDQVRRIWQAPTSPESSDPYTKGQMLAPPIPIFRIVRV